ncbi:SHOCT domain-containing protein [Adlercreutzia sp. ZJ138]|uniref:SHOCT domain-containing protein n=1 Tax=Adlercreutzia sp. ZJ138 TaxID=2709405 RepID=UPI0013ECF069|nr:SHOCT domain-containing protein [Adlercreutzia sp. ZJ138]
MKFLGMGVPELLIIFISLLIPLLVIIIVAIICLSIAKKRRKKAALWQNAPKQLEDYKRLMDTGVITSDEFEKKKREILDV